MTDDPATALPVIVAEWKRNSRETIRVQLAHSSGQNVIDVRNWYAGTDGELKPGRAGLTLAMRHLPALAASITEALATATRLELLPPAE